MITWIKQHTREIRRGVIGGLVFALWAGVIQSPPWQLLVFIFVGGAIFTVFILRQVSTLKRELVIGDAGNDKGSNHENNEGLVETTPRIVGEWAYIKVQNTGKNSASFSARMMKLTGTDSGELPYTLAWTKGVDKDRPEWMLLRPGEVAFLKITSLSKGDGAASTANFYSADSENLQGSLRAHSDLEFAIEIHSSHDETWSCRKAYGLTLGGEGKWSSFKEAQAFSK